MPIKTVTSRISNMPFLSLQLKSELKETDLGIAHFIKIIAAKLHSFSLTIGKIRTDFGYIMLIPLFCRNPLRFSAAKMSIAASKTFVLC